ncbi:PD-(D/E)XK motif protein [Streptacidiphilus sp. N1-10]|uniref:PD-(D/E)XK motif protein n=1 Tax=Streptacidiphilus jeojiensis TaxID=3229225 RepID=A0ABV6XIN2_9ACTN
MKNQSKQPGWHHELRPNWPILSARKDEGEVASCPIGPRLASGNALMAVDRYGGRHLLVPVRAGVRVDSDQRSAHVRIDGRTLEIAGRRTAFLDVSCGSGELFGVFDDLLSAMLEGITASQTEPVQACLHVWHAWRKLFQGRSDVLSDTSLRGLFAELVILDRILAIRGAIRLGTVWKGPDHASHDFRIGDDALEVKSLGAQGATIQIHGLGQLEPPPAGILTLVLVRLQSSEQEGQTLPELVGAVRERAEDGTGLSLQLAKAGYFDDHAEAYEDRRFDVTQIAVLPVGPDFPRLTPGSLSVPVAPEISGLTYSLDLSSRLADSIPAEELDRFIERGVFG